MGFDHHRLEAIELVILNQQAESAKRDLQVGNKSRRRFVRCDQFNRMLHIRTHARNALDSAFAFTGYYEALILHNCTDAVARYGFS
jgi:hypothetical protein